MSVASGQAPRPRLRWWLLIGLVLGAQVGLIVLLSEKSPAYQRSIGTAPAFRLAGPASGELLALNDPTLFALPHRQGFSGAAWLRTPAHKLPSFDWSDEPHWLRLPFHQLGQTFSHFMQINALGLTEARDEIEPELRLPEIAPPAVFRPQSTFRLQGGLALRRLVKSFELRSWAHSDILTNTVVSVAVNPEGRIVSAKLLKRSGFGQADEHALKQATGARFESLIGSGPKGASNPPGPLTWGEMIFEWHTMPAVPTNSAAKP